jgi:WhiB family redox-sensing transcriptional regulator
MNATTGRDALDAPILEERPWVVYSACKNADPSIFFAATRADERSALAICGTCTVSRECLDFAVETRERFGVWGGTSERDRRKMLKR